MQTLLNEEQQIEFIQRLWGRFGILLIVSVFSIIFFIGGVQFLKQYHQKQAAAASIVYETLIEAAKKNNRDTALAQANTLVKHYKKTVYASYAHLILAKLAINEKLFDQAINSFKWVTLNANKPVLKELACVRWIRLLIHQNQIQAALDLIQKNNFKIFKPIVDELEGDAAMTLGQRAHARAAYQSALDGSSLERPLLAMKRAQLATTDL